MKLHLNPQWTSVLLTLTFSPLLWADTQLPTIVVSASRMEQNSIETPASITIITRQEIEQTKSQNLLQLLQSYGGIQINSLFGNGNGATIDMRGFGDTASRNSLILVDGRRLNNSADIASPDLNSIDLARIERIEIVQGSAGTLYGNQAVGGMINIITRRPEDFTASAEASIGSFQERSISAQLSQRITNGFSYRLAANKRQSDNYRENSKSDRKDFALRFDYEHDSAELFLEQQLVDDYQELPGALFREEMIADPTQSATAYAGDFSDARSTVTRFGLSGEISRYWHFEGEASYRHNDREFKSSFRTLSCEPSTQERKVKGFNPRLIAQLPMTTGEATLTTGVDLERTDYGLLSCFGPQEIDQSIDAFYVQLTAPLNDLLSSTAGWRHAKVDNDIISSIGNGRFTDSLGVGSLGLVYRPGTKLRLFVRVDENYRFATVDEHTNVVFGQPVGIENQTGVSYEMGIEWQDAGINAKAVLYRLDLEDEISFDTTGFYYYNINLEKTRREGLILEANWHASPKLTLAGSFTYTDPTITAGTFKDNRIPLVSERSARLSLNWTPSQHWQLYAESILRSDRGFGNDYANTYGTLPGYGLINIGGSYHNDPWSLSLRLDNLLDKTYSSSGSTGLDESFTTREAFFPAPERAVRLTARYQFD
jgi:iron complex outermembrane receptor protein